MTAEDIRTLLGLFITDTSGLYAVANTTAEFMGRTARDRRIVAQQLVRGARTLRMDADEEAADAFTFCAGLLLWKNKEQASGQ